MPHSATEQKSAIKKNHTQNTTTPQERTVKHIKTRNISTKITATYRVCNNNLNSTCPFSMRNFTPFSFSRELQPFCSGSWNTCAFFQGSITKQQRALCHLRAEKVQKITALPCIHSVEVCSRFLEINRAKCLITRSYCPSKTCASYFDRHALRDLTPAQFVCFC